MVIGLYPTTALNLNNMYPNIKESTQLPVRSYLSFECSPWLYSCCFEIVSLLPYGFPSLEFSYLSVLFENKLIYIFLSGHKKASNNYGIPKKRHNNNDNNNNANYDFF